MEHCNLTNNMKFILIVLALSGVSLLYIPSTISLFSGGHSYYNIDPIGNQIPCQKCHADIQMEIHNGFKHNDLKCEDCHRTKKGVQYASGDDSYERMLYINVTGPAKINYRVLATTIQNYQQGNFPKSISGEISIDQWAIAGNDIIELRNTNDQYSGNMTAGDTGILYNYADVSNIPAYNEDATPKDTDNATKYSGLDTRKIKVNSDPYGVDDLTGAGSREVTPGTLAHASTTILCAECHQDYLNTHPDTVHDSFINYSMENNVNDACIACHTSVAVSIKWTKPSAISINTESDGFYMKITDTNDIFPREVETFGNQSGDLYATDLALSVLAPVEGYTTVSSISELTSTSISTLNSTSSPGTLLFDGSFNNGTPGTPLISSQCPQNIFITPWRYCFQLPSKVTISDIYRNGERAALFTTLAANPDTYGIDRSEIVITKGVTNLGREGDDLYYGWSMLFPSSWTVPQSWELVFQMKGYNRVARNPAISFNIESDNNIKVVRCTGNFGSSTSLCPTGLVSYPTPILNINNIKDKWVDYVMRVRFAVDNSGIIEVWFKIDGQSSYTKAVEWQNIPTLQYDPVVGTKDIYHLLIGPYRGHESNTQDLYATGVKIGTTRLDVE